MAAYVYGVLRFDWGFNELAGAFFIGGCAAGLIGGFGVIQTLNVYVEGMQALLPAALLIGIARAISLVLEDGRVVDTILNAFADALRGTPAIAAALLMIPVHGLIHILVPSVSGQAVLTMPVMVPLADLLHLHRMTAVLAYTAGAGLMEFLSPTNGALLALLAAAGVPFQKWIRFSIGGVLLVLGLFTRWAAFILSGEMAFAYFMVHAPRGFFPMLNLGELAVVYCFTFLYLFVAGGGEWSLDRMRASRA